MEGLDLLKKDWKKNENSFQQVSAQQIYKMIHKSSSSIVKWIFIISVLEFVAWTLLSFCMKDTEVMQKFNSYHVEHIMLPFTIIWYVGLAYFLFQFFINHRKISTTDNSKVLIKNIIRTRKTVHQYVWFNIIYIILSSILVMFIQLNYDKDILNMINEFDKTGNVAVLYAIYIALTVVFLGVFVVLIWLFYKLIYGILLKRLYRNYEELKKIDL